MRAATNTLCPPPLRTQRCELSQGAAAAMDDSLVLSKRVFTFHFACLYICKAVYADVRMHDARYRVVARRLEAARGAGRPRVQWPT